MLDLANNLPDLFAGIVSFNAEQQKARKLQKLLGIALIIIGVVFLFIQYEEGWWVIDPYHCGTCTPPVIFWDLGLVVIAPVMCIAAGLYLLVRSRLFYIKVKKHNPL